jgi:hypothetical protein
MSRKILLIILGALLLLLLVLGGAWLLQRQKTTTPATNTNVNRVLPNVNNANANKPANTNAKTNTPVDVTIDEQNTVKSIAKNFAGIYGSYSTQNNYKNITDLYFFMAPALRTQQEQYVADQRSKAIDTSLYHGMSSEARVVHMDAFDSKAGTAAVTITLYRTEYTGTTSNATSFIQPLTLTFEKADGSWKIAKLAWGQKQ